MLARTMTHDHYWDARCVMSGTSADGKTDRTSSGFALISSAERN
jgi:hypothetical protein